MSEENKNLTENRMGTQPVGRLLLSLGLPMIASMLVSALYNVVDSIFVARITDINSAGSAGTDALVAVGLAFPFQTLMIAFAAGTGVGMNSMLSKALGAGDRETVNKAADNGLFSYAMCFVAFFLVGSFLPEILIRSSGGTGLALTYGTQYLRIVCMASFGLFTQFCFERMLQATGKTVLSMIAQMTGAVINIILDP
ncbi:MAG: MATE family efflux transporter, partial [Lachnospiraceae bacterium]|nr:MATE family efflux transporter [Lachnospiraceae bacterium]